MKNTIIAIIAALIAIFSAFWAQAKGSQYISCGEGKIWFYYTSIEDPAVLANRLDPVNYMVARSSEYDVLCNGRMELCAICAYADVNYLPLIESEQIETDLMSYDHTSITQFPTTPDIKEKYW